MSLIAGRGWAAGTFANQAPWWNSVALSVPIVIAIVLGAGVPRGREGGLPSPRWATIGMRLYAGLSFILAVGSIVAGQSGFGAHFFGVKTSAEVIPTVIIALGALLWLAPLARRRRRE